MRFLILSTLVLLGGCGSDHSPQPHNDGGAGQGGANSSTSTGFTGDPSICGDEVHHPSNTYPLVYFVIDRSGSMLDVDAQGVRLFDRVQDAAVDLVRDLGALVRVGAAVFPAESAQDGTECVAGEQVYTPKLANTGAFRNAIDIPPFGGTPISATLTALRPILAAEPGPKAVILATDGGPNCNPDTVCTASQCMVNIFGECPADIDNCCDPAVGGTPLNCVDRAASISAVQDLAMDGSLVYVVGIPGSELFAGVLDQLALNGGAPQQNSDTYYYKVQELDTLADVFREIGASLISCTYDLADPPEAPGKTNVYFDGEVVYQDANNGWVWVDADTIDLVGDACAALKAGKVREVQIVSGCPTETPL